MRTIKIFSFILLIGSFTLNSCTKKVTTISGTVEKNAKVLFSNVNLKICYDAFLDTMITDDNGKFQLNLSINEERFIVVQLPASERKYILPIMPGEDYQISVDKNGKMIVRGANEEGIELYQSVLQYDPYNFNSSAFSGNSLKSRNQTIEQLKKVALDPFKKLLAENKISKKFYQLIESDRDCYYAFVSAWLYSWDYMGICMNPTKDDDELAKEQVKKNLEALFTQYKPDDPQIMKAPIWQMYTEFIYIKVYQQYLLKKIDKSNIDSLLSEENIPFWFERMKASFSDNTLEAILAVFLYTNAGPEGFSESKESIPVYEYFKTNFPNSYYLKYFKQLMERTISFYNDNKVDANIKFVQGGDSIDTFAELISLFKGKKLYVDVWSSWCAPCRGEFKYKESLAKIMEEYNITPLYISLDQEEQKARWEAIIYTHNLKGYHFRANKPFIDDLNRIYQEINNSGSLKERGNKSFSIPWYIMIDENSKIINSDAPRPSNTVEIEELFSKK